MNKKHLIIGASIFVVAVVAISIILKTYLDSRATIYLMVTPESAQILIDGNTVEPGEHTISSGNHTVAIRKDGFYPHEETFDLAAGSTKNIRIALEPNSPDTINWYLDHPEDASIADGIVSQTYNEESDKIVQNNPIILVLPYAVPGSFKIDYGSEGGLSFYLKVSLFIYPDDPETALDANTQLSEEQKTAARQPFTDWLATYRQSSNDNTEYTIRYNYIYY